MVKMVSLGNIFLKIKEYTKECLRVLRVTKKPSTIEFKTIVKVSAVGMALIGMIGFIVTMVRQLLG